MERIEYRVRPVTRYIVTRFHSEDGERQSCCSQTKGEFDNVDTAYQVAYALAKDEHERLGWPPGDERIQYPERPNRASHGGPMGTVSSKAITGAIIT